VNENPSPTRNTGVATNSTADSNLILYACRQGYFLPTWRLPARYATMLPQFEVLVLSLYYSDQLVRRPTTGSGA
jgi:hypothetical protein